MMKTLALIFTIGLVSAQKSNTDSKNEFGQATITCKFDFELTNKDRTSIF